jgi:hypothetical protein
MGIIVRAEPLGGEGGGLCRIGANTYIFVDTMADLATRCRRTLEALAETAEVDRLYLRPELRDAIERIRAERSRGEGSAEP